MLNTSRRNFLRQSSMMAGALILPDYAAPLNWLFPAAGQMKPLRNNVGVYTNRGGTIAWMISKKGIVVVDTQFPAEAADLVEQIRKQNQRPVDLLINTATSLLKVSPKRCWRIKIPKSTRKMSPANKIS